MADYRNEERGVGIDAKLVLGLHAAEFGRFAEAVRTLAAHIPARASARQLVAFAILASKHAANEPITIAELQAMAGEDAEGHPLLGDSIRRGYGLFEELNWIELVPDEHDKRRKVVRLTEAGIEIAAKITAIVEDL